jgi:hypothetical protein
VVRWPIFRSRREAAAALLIALDADVEADYGRDRARTPGGVRLETMQPLKAHVHNGRLVLDEPTDLPEGEVVLLQPVDATRDDAGTSTDEDELDLTDAQLAGLAHAFEQADRGETIPLEQVHARLEAKYRALS